MAAPAADIAAAMQAQPLLVDKTEKFHTAVDFLPVLELKTE